MRIVVIFCGLFFSGLVVGDDPDDVRQAFAAIDWKVGRNWAYTETRLEQGTAVVGRYDPRRPSGERWSLLSIDGRQPTAVQSSDYLEGRDDKGERGGDDFGLEIVDLDSLELIEENDDRRIYRFKPAIEPDADDEERAFMAQVLGRLSVARDGHYLETLELRNERAIRPAAGVRISRFRTLLSFGRPGTSGPVVPLSVDVELKGRALLIVTIDEKESIRYSDFEFVGTRRGDSDIL